MALSRDQAEATLQRLEQAAAQNLAAAQAANDQGSAPGVVHGALWLFGADHDAQLGAQVGAAKIHVAAVQRLRSDEDAAIADPVWGDRWIGSANSIAGELKTTGVEITQATVDDTVKLTASATGDSVKHDVNQIAGAVATVAWHAAPWWVIAGGLLVVGGYVFLRVRALR